MRYNKSGDVNARVTGALRGRIDEGLTNAKRERASSLCSRQFSATGVDKSQGRPRLERGATKLFQRLFPRLRDSPKKHLFTELYSSVLLDFGYSLHIGLDIRVGEIRKSIEALGKILDKVGP
ncbi:hypothetical protein KM043_002809 [Ampulex compressa]|nr:hypothetical protein KM043_002809 [Ampulex compressa]